jgi:hypothetical protein
MSQNQKRLFLMVYCDSNNDINRSVVAKAEANKLKAIN